VIVGLGRSASEGWTGSGTWVMCREVSKRYPHQVWLRTAARVSLKVEPGLRGKDHFSVGLATT